MRQVRPVRGIKGWAAGALVVLVLGLALARGLKKEPGRIEMPPFLGLPDQLELEDGRWALKPAFTQLSFDDPVALVQAPLSNTLFVCEREGTIVAFENDEAGAVKRPALDLSHVTQGELDSGLLGLAFHPEFGKATSPNRSYAYIHYAYTQAPIVGRRPPG